MKSIVFILILNCLFITQSITAQPIADRKKVVVTGARFAYPLVKKWIADYQSVDPSIEIVIDPRTTTDPKDYDLLIEAYELADELKDKRELITFGNYALLPVANANSAFGKTYSKKGLSNEIIRQVYFQDIYADQEKQKKITEPFQVYTRLQTAGAPVTFAKHFGFEQQNIQGKAIAGADEHLIKAILKDENGITYAPLSLIYDLSTKKVLSGISILSIDTDDNGRLSDEEQIPADLDKTIELLDKNDAGVPVGSLHISIAKHNYTPEALKFLKWIIENSQDDLQAFGLLKPDEKRFQLEKEKFDQLASNR